VAAASSAPLASPNSGAITRSLTRAARAAQPSVSPAAPHATMNGSSGTDA
jgi:hypothetical protein